MSPFYNIMKDEHRTSPEATVLQNRDHYERIEDGEYVYQFVRKGSAANTIDSIKTFSYDSDDDFDLCTSFDLHNNNCFAIDEGDSWVATGLKQKQSIQERKASVMNTVHSPIVVTPEKSKTSIAVETSLDCLPTGFDVLRGSNIANDGYFYDHTELVATRKDDSLLFPSIDDPESSETRVAAPGIRPSLSHFHHTICRGKSLDGECDISKATDSLKYVEIPHDLHDSDAYRLLRPSLPLPDSLRATLCLLLQMEFWHSDRTDQLECACEIVHEKLRQHKSDRFCNRKRDVNKKRNENDIEAAAKSTQKSISGDIIDAMVERIGSSIDLAILFEASAELNNTLTATYDRRLDIFFHRGLNNASLEHQRKRLTLRELTGNQISNKLGSTSGKTAPHDACFARKKRKASVHSDENDCDIVTYSEFVPTKLQLAIAFSACSKMVTTPTKSRDLLSLEDYVKGASKDLEDMSKNEIINSWNTLVNIWDGRAREMRPHIEYKCKSKSSTNGGNSKQRRYN